MEIYFCGSGQRRESQLPKEGLGFQHLPASQIGMKGPNITLFLSMNNSKCSWFENAGVGRKILLIETKHSKCFSRIFSVYQHCTNVGILSSIIMFQHLNGGYKEN